MYIKSPFLLASPFKGLLPLVDTVTGKLLIVVCDIAAIYYSVKEIRTMESCRYTPHKNNCFAKTTASQSKFAISCQNVHGQYFMVVVFAVAAGMVAVNIEMSISASTHQSDFIFLVRTKTKLK